MRGKLLPLLVAALLCSAAPIALLHPAEAAKKTTVKTAAARAVPIRIGAHETYTRVVVDFARRTAYRIERSGDVLTLIFDTPGHLAPPADHERLITQLSAAKPDAQTARLTIGLAANTGYKDYRSDEKIVIDLYPQSKAAAAKQKLATAEQSPKNEQSAGKAGITETPLKAPAVKPAPVPLKATAAPAAKTAAAPTPGKPSTPALTREDLIKAINETLNPGGPVGPPVPKPGDAAATPAKPADAAATAATTATATQTATATPATTATTTAATATPAVNPAASAAAAEAAAKGASVIVDKPGVPATAANVKAPSTAAPDAEEPTVVTISLLEPAKLAVFSRFNTLWIVLDTETAGAVAPSASGPLAGLMGNAKPLTFKGGTAYRYTMPPDRGIYVEQQNLAWRIIMGGPAMPPPATASVSVEAEEATGKAKLVAELKDASKVMEVQDPLAGDTLEVVAANDQSQRIRAARRFADLELLPTAIGLVARPIKDNLHFNRIQDFILITSDDGINATPGATAGPAVVASDATPIDEARLFDFPNWRQGGITRLSRNVHDLEVRISKADKPADRTALLMKLALLYFANNFGQESIGVLNIISDEAPEMIKNPNFIALRGAASALAGRYDDALKDLSNPAIQNHGEVSLWLGFAAAATEQWRLANHAFPSDNRLLLQYPENIAAPFTIYMAESALRLGHTDTAKTLLASLDAMAGSFDSHSQAAVQYLKGEAARQAGDAPEAIRLWRPVAGGLDRLYHTKAALAMANLQLQEKLITVKQAIDAVDSLRFAWRGDGLEVQILQNLGRLKVQDGRYLLGLEDMKTAATLADSLMDDTSAIHEEMAKIFTDLFVNNKAKNIPPLEAISVYNEFKTLMPQGAEGTTATLNFADSLISMDLLEKAEGLLADQLKANAVPPEKVAATENKLAAVYLLDSLPEKALATLSSGSPPTEERQLLKARALSDLGKTDDAITALSPLASPDALKLKADTLWRAKKWADAAATIEQLLPPPAKLLTTADAQLVVNAAVAYKLAGDNVGLANIKQRYDAVMAATTLASTFGTVTRTGGKSALTDRDTIVKIIDEVDMFKGFLDAYKNGKGS